MADNGHLRSGLTTDGRARVLEVDVTPIAREIRARHALGPRASHLAAEGAVATALLSAHIKGAERITLQVQSSTPEVAFIGDVDADGRLRGRLTPNTLPTPWSGTLDGALLAIKSIGRRELYRGVTPIEGVSLEAALRHHLSSSAQVKAGLTITVRSDPDGAITSATGTYVERLPGAPAGPMDPTTLNELEKRALRWHCTCSQQRVESMLIAVGPDELRAMRVEDGGADVTCDFCLSVYHVDSPRLLELETAARG